jgi:putative peptidoglycan lipid II flippase
MLLTVPAAAALVAIPHDIVSVLFERGAFTAHDTPFTSHALWIFALGLPAFVLIKVFSPAYFARHDTKTPMRYAGWSLSANTIGSIALFFLFRRLGWMPHLGIAVATTLGGWMNALLLGWGLTRMNHFETDARLRRALPMILLSSLVMAAALLGTAPILEPWLRVGNGVLTRFSALAALVTIGAAVYFAAAQITGAVRLGQLTAAFGRK